MDTNIKFQKIKTTERNLDLKPTKFSRIFLIDTTITILDDCILFGDYKINLRVKYASKSNNFLVFNTTKSLYLLDFKIKVLYKFEGDDQDFIKAEFNGENLEVLYSNGIYKSYKIGEILEDKEIEIRKEEGVGYFYKEGKVINKVGDKGDEEVSEEVGDDKDDNDGNINKTDNNELDNDYDQVLSTPFGDIFIKNEKMIFKDQEIENELFYGDNDDKIYYYSTSFKDFILLGSSNNSNLYLYDFNLNVMDNEGEDAIYIQADENHNQLYIRGMDYNKGRLVLIDLKGNVVEYCVKINNEEPNEVGNESLSFKSKIMKIQGDKLKIEDCELEELKEITENKNVNDDKHDTKIEKPSIKLSENPEGLSFIQFKKDLLSSDELREDQTFTDEEISILSKNDNEEDLNEIFKTMNFDDNNNLSDLKNNMTGIKKDLTYLKSNLTDKKSVFGDIKSNITEKQSNPFSFSFNKENSKREDVESSKSFDVEGNQSDNVERYQSDITENNQDDVAENSKNVFGNEDVNNQSVLTASDKNVFTESTKSDVTTNAKSVFGNDGKFNQSVSTTNTKSPFTESTKSVFTESTKSVFGKAVEPSFEKPESVKSVFNKEVPKSPFTKNSSFETTSSQSLHTQSNLSQPAPGFKPSLSQPAPSFKPTPFQPNLSQPISLQSSKPSLDSVDDIISAILSIKTNSVTINNYKINNITDRLESQIYSSMSKLKRINDIKREIESNLLIMINNLNSFNRIDSKSIEDSMRYFDEVIERRTRHKTPLIYNSPIIEPDLRKINQISTTLEEDLSKLNLNILTQIKLEPVFLIDKLKIKYKEDEDRDKEAEGDKDIREEVKEGRPQTNPNFYVKNNPEKESNLQPTITQLNTQPNIPKPINQPTTPQPSIPQHTPLQPTIPHSIPQPTQPLTNPFQSSPSQPNSSDIFNRVLGSSIPVIQKEENKDTNNKPPSAFSKFASSHNLFK